MTAVVLATGTTANVSLVTPTGPLVSSKVFRVIPTITSFMPASGLIGTSVVVTGTGLTQTSKVTFGGVKAAVVSVNSATQVTATVPSGAKTGKIGITSRRDRGQRSNVQSDARDHQLHSKQRRAGNFCSDYRIRADSDN